MTDLPRFNERYEKLSKPKAVVQVNKSLHFEPSRLAFNFSFVTRDKKYSFSGKNFDKVARLKLLDKMIRLSTDDLVLILSWPRQVGFESLPEDEVRLAINPEFRNSGRHADCLAKLWIFRLAKTGRVIGKIQGTTFYVLGVDTSFDLYRH